ncbi:MAG: twin-arginine translocation signal domain-containing protein [Candidatus Binataceae bacterium]|nr:twin-arginine translocation signal domain-containing protein [Candidatus Binataceae bacterium]
MSGFGYNGRMFKPTRRGFLQALLAAPVVAPVAAAVQPAKPLTVHLAIDNQEKFFAGMGDYMPSAFHVPQSFRYGHSMVTLDGLHPRGIQ